MWRDPLDELIADLERIVPATAPRCAFDPAALCMEADRLEREFALEQAQHPRVEKTPSIISIAPAVWPTKPARRRDPSAPTWDAAAVTDADPDDSSG